MKIGRLLLILCFTIGIVFAANSDETITFQGYLTDNKNEPYMGTVKMGFKFFPTSNKTTTTEIFPSGLTNERMRNVTVFNGNYTTKINFTQSEITAMNALDDIWVEVYVTTNTSIAITNLFADAYKLDSRIQMSAVPYALSVKGLYYDSVNDVVMHGDKDTFVKNGAVSVNSNTKGGLLVQGSVGIGITSTTVNGTAYKLAVSNANNTSFDAVRVTGNVIVKSGMVSASMVYGAVWN